MHYFELQQYLPLAVLKQSYSWIVVAEPILFIVATVPTACGIETKLKHNSSMLTLTAELQQYLPLAVCDEGCEAAEERSDDEGRTSLVPDRMEGKTKVMK